MADLPLTTAPHASLERVLAGDASPDERWQVDAWLQEHPAAAELIERYRSNVWRHSAQAQAFDAQRSLDRLHTKLARGRAHTVLPRKRIFTAWMAAPVVVLAVGLAIVTSVVLQRHTTPTQQRFATRAGQRRDVILGTHMRATLGPTTMLTVTTGSPRNGQDMTVDLTGEAVFTVSHNANTPFIVRTGSVTTRVLGTRFMVRRYAHERQTRVAVTSGRVAIHAGSVQGNAVISAGTLALVNDSGGVTVTPHIAVDDYTAWTRGRLVFERTPLSNVLTELSRAYGVDIRLADSAHTAYTFTFSADVSTQSLDDVLDALVLPLNAHYTHTRGLVTIAPGSAPMRSISPHPLSATESFHGR